MGDTTDMGGASRRAAPANPLSREDLAEFRRLLLVLRQKATGNISFLTTDSLKPLPAEDEDEDSFDADFALSVAGSEQNVVYEIDEALRRIDQGTYGICELTGAPIPRARLRAIPHARFCVEAQSQQEGGARGRRRGLQARSRLEEPSPLDHAEDGDSHADGESRGEEPAE